MGDVFTEDILDDKEEQEDVLPLVSLEDSSTVDPCALKSKSADNGSHDGPHITTYTHLRKIASFAEPSKTTMARSIIVIVDRPGPLHMQLKIHPSRKCVMLHGFDRDEDGEKGELEQSGKLQEKDLLIDINGKSLERKSFKEVLRLIRHETLGGGPRVLSLIRFSTAEAETDYFGHCEETGADSSAALSLMDSDCFARTDAVADLGTYISNLLTRDAVIDMTRLRGIAAHGLPDVDGVRALVWMVLLG